MKSRALAFGCLLVGGALALICSAQPWWRATGEGVVMKFTGTQVTGGLSQALGIVSLAGTLLMLVLKARGRRVVGALLLLVGMGVVLTGAFRLRPSADAVRSQVREVSLADVFQLGVTAWPWAFALSGVLIVAGAALTIATAGRWPSQNERFRPEVGPAKGTMQLAGIDDPAGLWKAMDAGADPTADDHDTPTVDDPKMRDRSPGDTMDATEQAQQSFWSLTSRIPAHVERDWRGNEA